MPDLDVGHFGALWHLVTIGHLISSEIDRIARTLDLSVADLQLLGTLRINDAQQVRATDLARALFVSNAVLTSRIQRLADAGLLLRDATDDRRSFRLRLTEVGAQTIDQAIARVAREAQFPRILRQLSQEDREQLDRLLGPLHLELARHHR
jgi:DNA-binding MarR family transcriptional regulator